MKRLIYFLAIVMFFAAAAAVLIKPVIVSLAKSQFKRVFAGSTVFIQGCEFKPFRQIGLSGIEIERPGTYSFRIKEINLRYNLLSLLPKNIFRFSLMDVVQGINFLDLRIDSLSVKNVRVENVSLQVDRARTGGFSVRQMQYDKFKIADVGSKVRLEDKNLVLDSLSAQTLNGRIQGNLTFKMDNPLEYAANLKFINIDIERLVEDFKLNERFQMSGGVNGNLVLNGRGAEINILRGDFSSTESGGTLTITDNQFLERMARNSQQYLDIVVESFRNYRYNKGVMKLSLEQGNLILDAELDADAGRRNINITLHDFKFDNIKSFMKNGD